MVRNTKAKIRRTDKKYGIDLSNEIKIPALEDFKTREEFNKFKEQKESFTNRANQKFQFKKNEFGVVASKKEIREIEENTKKAQRIADKIKKEVSKKPFISGGKVSGTVGQRMQQMAKPDVGGISRPPDFNFDKMRSRRDLEKKKENMEKRADDEFIDKRMQQNKENFIHLLKLSLNSDADELIKELREVPAEDFHEMYMMFEDFDFDMWDSERMMQSYQESLQHVSKMLQHVERYKAGNIDMDLKGF